MSLSVHSALFSCELAHRRRSLQAPAVGLGDLRGAPADDNAVAALHPGLTAAIWHNDQAGQPALRLLIAYDY
jgi:hypothetical protein